ncbi:MAG: hypothetical protein IKP00_04565 [Victivallales bacterium]|nr:hypothetical protein [Victivallales bacterium]
MKKLAVWALAVCGVLCADEVLENEFLKAVISERGGKVVSLVEKSSGQELAAGVVTDNQRQGAFGGIGKTVDTLFNNVESLALKYELAHVGNDTVTATVMLQQSSLAGVVLTRTFQLPKNQAALVCTTSLCSKQKENSFSLKFHNSIILPDDSVFTLPAKEGYAVVPYTRAKMEKLSAITEIAQPWIAALGAKGGKGVALYVNTPHQLKNLFQWNCESLEATFRQITIKPIAEADEWSASISIIPFAGKGKVVSVTPEVIFTLDGKQGTLFFVQSFGSCIASLDGKTIGNVEAKAGTSWSFQAEGKQLVLASANKQLTVDIPTEWKSSKPLTKLPKTEEVGVNGYYYHFPELWISDEIDAEVHIGLRGNFKKMNNFRLLMALPPGVELTFSRDERKDVGEVTVKGKVLHGIEIYNRRRVSYASAVEQVLFRQKEGFQDGSTGYVYAVWDGGAQEPYPIVFKKTPKFPEIGDGLKHFSLGLGCKTARPTPQWRKFGVNFYEFYDYVVPDFIEECKGADLYTRRQKEAEAAGLNYGVELGALFSRYGDVLKGNFLKAHGTIFFPEKKVYELNPKEFQAINMDGKPVPFICPSYRGPYWEKTLDLIRVAKYYGFKSVTFDDEDWAEGVTLCHCPRCLKKFGKDPAKYPKEWLEYKTDQVQDMYRQMREVMGEDVKFSTWLDNGAPEKSITHRLSDYRKIGKYVDYIKPMLYTADSATIGYRSRAIADLLKGTRAKLIMGLSPDRMYEYYRVASGNYASPNVMREQVLEAIFNGAVGIHVWNHPYGMRAALGFYNMARAVQDLMPVEDIIYYGKLVDIPSSNPEVLVTAYEYNGEYAFFARNYDRGVVKTTILGQDIVFDKDRVAVLKVKK